MIVRSLVTAAIGALSTALLYQTPLFPSSSDKNTAGETGQLALCSISDTIARCEPVTVGPGGSVMKSMSVDANAEDTGIYGHVWWFGITRLSDGIYGTNTWSPTSISASGGTMNATPASKASYVQANPTTHSAEIPVSTVRFRAGNMTFTVWSTPASPSAAVSAISNLDMAWEEQLITSMQLIIIALTLIGVYTAASFAVRKLRALKSGTEKLQSQGPVQNKWEEEHKVVEARIASKAGCAATLAPAHAKLDKAHVTIAPAVDASEPRKVIVRAGRRKRSRTVSVFAPDVVVNSAIQAHVDSYSVEENSANDHVHSTDADIGATYLPVPGIDSVNSPLTDNDALYSPMTDNASLVDKSVLDDDVVDHTVATDGDNSDKENGLGWGDSQSQDHTLSVGTAQVVSPGINAANIESTSDRLRKPTSGGVALGLPQVIRGQAQLAREVKARKEAKPHTHGQEGDARLQIQAQLRAQVHAAAERMRKRNMSVPGAVESASI